MMPHRSSRNFYVQRRLPHSYNRGLIAYATIHCNTMAARPPCRRRNRWIDLPLKSHLEALFPSRLWSPLRRALAVTMTGMGATSKKKRGRPLASFRGCIISISERREFESGRALLVTVYNQASSLRGKVVLVTTTCVRRSRTLVS
jgi:hypothetical protein